MDLAARMAREGAAEGLVVSADEQTAGRGRHGRNWVSTPGRDLLASIVFRPRPALLPQMQFVAALAAVEAVRVTTGASPTIKWPNDVRVAGSKVCGVLVESYDGPGGLIAIAGFGINVHTSSANSPDLPPAVSLSELAGREVDRAGLLERLVESAGWFYRRAMQGESLLRAWSSLLDTTGQFVEVRAGVGGHRESVVSGTAEGVDEHGRLLVRDEVGRVWPLSAGDVTLSETLG